MRPRVLNELEDAEACLIVNLKKKKKSNQQQEVKDTGKQEAFPKEPKSMAPKKQTRVTAIPLRLSEAETTPVPSLLEDK